MSIGSERKKVNASAKFFQLKLVRPNLFGGQGYNRRAKQVSLELHNLSKELNTLTGLLGNPGEGDLHLKSSMLRESLAKSLLESTSISTRAEDLGLTLTAYNHLVNAIGLPEDYFEYISPSNTSKKGTFEQVTISQRTRNQCTQGSLEDNIREFLFRVNQISDNPQAAYAQLSALKQSFQAFSNSFNTTTTPGAQRSYTANGEIAHLYLALTQRLLGKHVEASKTVKTIIPNLRNLNLTLDNALQTTRLFLESELGVNDLFENHQVFVSKPIIPDESWNFLDISNTAADSLIPLWALQQRFDFKTQRDPILYIADGNPGNGSAPAAAQRLAKVLTKDPNTHSTLTQSIQNHIPQNGQINLAALYTAIENNLNGITYQDFQERIFNEVNHNSLLSLFEPSTSRRTRSEFFPNSGAQTVDSALYSQNHSEGLRLLQEESKMETEPFTAAVLYVMSNDFPKAAEYVQKVQTNSQSPAEQQIVTKLFVDEQVSQFPEILINAQTKLKDKLKMSVFNMFADPVEAHYWATQAEKYAHQMSKPHYAELERMKMSRLFLNQAQIKPHFPNENDPNSPTSPPNSPTSPPNSPTSPPNSPTSPPNSPTSPPTQSPPPTTPPGSNSPKEETKNTNWWLWGGAGTGLTALIAGIIWYFAGQDDPTKRKPLQPGQQSPNGGGYSAYGSQQSPNAVR
jgi:hypothetical protein